MDVDAYIRACPEDRQAALVRLRAEITSALPAGFTETMQYGMISYVVPYSIYPAGYHVDPSQPLPFISIASQKYGIGLYHMGLYASAEMMSWFTDSYASVCKTKLDMGKSCIRFKRPETIPYDLIAQLASRMTAQEWVTLYEASRR